jgi:PAS domain S-box-containing protein
MNKSPSFDDIFAVMSAASVGDMATRVIVPDGSRIADTATRFALALNILLDDLGHSAALAQRELTERTRLAARLQILADASHEFSAATGDLRHLLDVVARRLGEAVGELCVIRTLTDDGEWLEPGAAAYHADADLLALAHDVGLAGRQRVGARVRKVIVTAEPILIAKTDTATFATMTDPSYAPFLERMQVASSLIVPLLCRGKVVGIASLLRSSADHPYGEDDVRFVQSLADHAALAIGNARSYAAERAARDAAEKATARFARLSEAGVIGTVVVDLDDRSVLDINDTLLHLVGYSRDELVSGRVAWTSLTPPEWKDVDTRAIEQLRTSGLADLREKEFIRKDGGRVPVLAGSAMLGGTTECISFVLDLTERKEADRGRREAERRAERMVESATVGMWTIDSEGRTTFMNARMANILGMDLAEALVTPVAQFFLTEDRPELSERLASRRAGVVSAYEQRFRKPDGAVGVLWIEASPMHDAQGRYEGVLGIVTDVTERRRAEEATRASETRYRMMFDNSPLPKWLYDAETLRFLDVNEATLRDYGYSREEFLSMTIKDIRPPEDVPALLEAERQVELHPKFGVWRLRKKSGEIMQVELTKHTFRLGDRVTRLAVGRDVTERLRLEDQLRQSQKMEAVGRLAGGVAHDFNNVLSVILSYADLVLADLKADEPMCDDVEEIRKAGQRAADLTRQLLMFSRQQVLEPKVLDLNEVLTSMDKMLQRILGADVDLVSLPAQPLGRVRVDRSSIEQVIMNLVVNARDAMPTGGKLTMETDNVVLDEAYAREHLGVTPGPHVMLAVTDTGTGIDKAAMVRIFEPFFTTKEAGKGTGLGLSTVFGIVQQSRGSVWVYSEPGKGTTFKVYLPRVDDAVDVVRTVVAPETLRGSETILLVEDDDQVRTVARGILGRSGYHVIEARNAGEALLHSEKHAGTIHLLLSDVVMPQMSGPELAKRLASSRPDMKVLCMSGYTDDSIVRHGVLEARIAYLQKPITPETLTTRVREVLDGSNRLTTERTR